MTILQSAIEATELAIQSVDGETIELKVGQGLRARTVAISIADFNDALGTREDDRTFAGAYARGIEAFLSEPSHSKASEMDFIPSTKSLLPMLETAGFEAGAKAAGSAELFSIEYVGGLRIYYYIELDEGIRLLPQAQADRWGVHPERIEKAALSMLFHRTNFGDLVPFPGVPHVDRFEARDALDGTRALILDSWDYPRCRKGIWFAVVSRDLILFTKDQEAMSLKAFAAVVDREFERAQHPLSNQIQAFVDGKLQRYN